MMRRSLGVIGAGALLAAAIAGPAAAQEPPDDPLGVVTIPPGEPVVIAG